MLCRPCVREGGVSDGSSGLWRWAGAAPTAASVGKSGGRDPIAASTAEIHAGASASGQSVVLSFSSTVALSNC